MGGERGDGGEGEARGNEVTSNSLSWCWFQQVVEIPTNHGEGARVQSSDQKACEMAQRN